MSDLAPTTPSPEAAPVAAPGASQPSAASADADVADFAAAVAALKAEVQPEAAKPAAPVAEPAKEPEKPATEQPKPPAEPSDDTKAILARMARLEFEAEQAREEAARLRGGTESAQKWAKLQELKASRDFAGVLTELGVTSDELQTMILEGNKPLSPEVVALQKQAKELADFKAQLQAREDAAQRARVQQEFKVKELAPALSADKFPLGRAVYGDGLVDEVFAVLQAEYRNGNQNPSIAAAGAAVERYLTELRAKLVPSQAVEPTKTTTPAQPVTATLTNTPTTAPKLAPDMDTEEGRLEAAMKILKGS